MAQVCVDIRTDYGTRDAYRSVSRVGHTWRASGALYTGMLLGATLEGLRMGTGKSRALATQGHVLLEGAPNVTSAAQCP